MNIDIESYENWKIGMRGEQDFRQTLINNKINFLQADALFKKDGELYCAEIKTQEHFEAPPFDGHGLPRWQVDARIKLFKENGIIPLLIVYDYKAGFRYIANLVDLEKGEKFQTGGSKPRVVYPLKNFKSEIIKK